MGKASRSKAANRVAPEVAGILPTLRPAPTNSKPTSDVREPFGVVFRLMTCAGFHDLRTNVVASQVFLAAERCGAGAPGNWRTGEREIWVMALGMSTT